VGRGARELLKILPGTVSGQPARRLADLGDHALQQRRALSTAPVRRLQSVQPGVARVLDGGRRSRPADGLQRAGGRRPNGTGGYTDGVCDPTQGFHFTDLTKENFGKIVSKHGHRVIELAARFEF
jgi:hypothetical protein